MCVYSVTFFVNYVRTRRHQEIWQAGKARRVYYESRTCVTKSLINPKSFHTKSRKQFSSTPEVRQSPRKLPNWVGKICKRRKKLTQKTDPNLQPQTPLSTITGRERERERGNCNWFRYRTDLNVRSFLEQKPTHRHTHTHCWVTPRGIPECCRMYTLTNCTRAERMLLRTSSR